MPQSTAAAWQRLYNALWAEDIAARPGIAERWQKAEREGLIEAAPSHLDALEQIERLEDLRDAMRDPAGWDCYTVEGGDNRRTRWLELQQAKHARVEAMIRTGAFWPLTS